MAVCFSNGRDYLCDAAIGLVKQGTVFRNLGSGVFRVNKQSEQSRDDGTRQLLISGAGMVATGLFCVLLLLTVLGGYTHTGATTNTGWFALIVALMAIPFGALLLGLGLAKWVRNLRER